MAVFETSLAMIAPVRYQRKQRRFRSGPADVGAAAGNSRGWRQASSGAADAR